MNDSVLQKIGGVAGILFGVLVAAAFLASGDSPDFVDDAESISEYFVDDTGKILLTATLALLSAFVLAWFANGLRDAMTGDDDRAVGAAGPVIGTVVLGSAIAATSYAIGGGALAVGALRADEQGAEAAAASFVYYDLFNILLGAAAPVGFAVLLSGAAVYALRGRGFLPAWLGWVSLLLALVGLIPPISWVLSIIIALWAILVGILLLRRPAPTGRQART